LIDVQAALTNETRFMSYRSSWHSTGDIVSF